MNSLLIIFVFDIIIYCTCNICPRAVEQATQATTRENLSSGSLTKRVSSAKQASKKMDFRYDSSQKTDNKVADETTRTCFLSHGPFAICVILP